jgi:hypothetical protein
MSYDPEIHQFLITHLEGIYANDLTSYHQTTHPELSLYEWWVTPHRIDGLSFHDYMMEANARLGSVFGLDPQADSAPNPRFDLANLHIQRYGDTAIASYTLLTSRTTSTGVAVRAHNESRVMVKFREGWQVVHVHKSPAWNAPYQPPAGG